MTILYIMTIIQTLILILFVNLTYIGLKRISYKYSRDVSKNINTLNYDNYEIGYFLTRIHVGYADYIAAKIPGVKTNEISSLISKRKIR